MRRIKRPFTDFAMSFCVPKLARFSAAFMPSILRFGSVNFDSGSYAKLGHGRIWPLPGRGSSRKRLGNCVELHPVDYCVMGFNVGIEKGRPLVRALGARL